MRFRARVIFIVVSVLRSLRLNSARGPGLAPGALCRNRFLDVLLPDGLQLLVLRGAKNFLQLRRAFRVDGMELLHLLHSGTRRIVLKSQSFWIFSVIGTKSVSGVAASESKKVPEKYSRY